jgi:hypothetical protein
MRNSIEIGPQIAPKRPIQIADRSSIIVAVLEFKNHSALNESQLNYLFCVWCGRRDLNPQAFWALAPKASVFAISPLPHVLSRDTESS